VNIINLDLGDRRYFMSMYQFLFLMPRRMWVALGFIEYASISKPHLYLPAISKLYACCKQLLQLFRAETKVNNYIERRESYLEFKVELKVRIALRTYDQDFLPSLPLSILK